jgi:hypothetical protein
MKLQAYKSIPLFSKIMNKSVVFIAPAAGRRVNPKHFIGYTPGGEGGGVNYDAFPDFYRHSFENAQCVPLIAITAQGQPDWGTKWKLAPAFELETRSQMHRVVRILEEHPLSEQECERLEDLAAMGPLTRKRLDERIERLGLVEEYDSELGYFAVKCTELFYLQAYGQYINLPYDGQIKLPRVDIHGKISGIEKPSTTTVVNLSTGEEKTYSLEPEVAVKNAYLQERGDFNWWDYDKRDVDISFGRLTVACGYWCAKLEQPFNAAEPIQEAYSHETALLEDARELAELYQEPEFERDF